MNDIKTKPYTIICWIAVIPVALLSIILSGLLFDGFLWGLTKIVPDNYFTLMPQGMISTIKSFFVTSFGMYGGVKIAPKKKITAGVALVTVNTLSYVVLFIYVYIANGLSQIGFATHFWPVMQAIAGLIAAPLFLFYIWRSKIIF